MTQVSKYPISKKVEERIFEVFQRAISNLKDATDIENFLHEFLSPVEKIMLAKRLSIAVLLEKGLDYEMIKQLLHVSPQTIAKVNLQRKYAGIGYRKVVERILAEDSAVEFWGKIEDVLAAIPHAKGASIEKQQKDRQKAKIASRKAF